MHTRAAAAAAIVVFVTSVVLGAPGGAVLLLVVVVVPLRGVRELMLRVRLAAMQSRFVRADSELAGPRDGRAAAAVVVLVQGVQVVTGIVLCAFGSFYQGVDYNNQQDEDPRRKDTGTGDARLHLEYQEHKDGHSCQDRRKDRDEAFVNTDTVCSVMSLFEMTGAFN